MEYVPIKKKKKDALELEIERDISSVFDDSNFNRKDAVEIEIDRDINSVFDSKKNLNKKAKNSEFYYKNGKRYKKKSDKDKYYMVQGDDLMLLGIEYKDHKKEIYKLQNMIRDSVKEEYDDNTEQEIKKTVIKRSEFTNKLKFDVEKKTLSASKVNLIIDNILVSNSRKKYSKNTLISFEGEYYHFNYISNLFLFYNKYSDQIEDLSLYLRTATIKFYDGNEFTIGNVCNLNLLKQELDAFTK